MEGVPKALYDILSYNGARKRGTPNVATGLKKPGNALKKTNSVINNNTY